jgi:Copper transport outer membrane protein, MctB
VINFRYHVVSLTAVFLALAIGLVVGTAALNGPASDALRSQVKGISGQNTQLRSQVTQLIAEANKNEQFANESAPLILNGRLTGRNLVVVSMEDSNTYVDSLTDTLGMSGAKLTGKVVIKDKFFDPKNNAPLLDLAHAVLPASLTQAPLNSNAAETAAYVLSAVLVKQTPPVSDQDLRTVLKAFEDAGYISASDDFAGPADGMVFVAAQPYTDSSGSSKNAAVLTSTDQFDRAGPLVVAANGVAGSGNIISEVRGDPTLSKTVSTVDNVATPFGRIATTLALVEQIQMNQAGHYGTTGGAKTMLPDLTP